MSSRRQFWLIGSKVLGMLTGMIVIRGTSVAQAGSGPWQQSPQVAGTGDRTGRILSLRAPGRHGLDYYLVLPGKPRKGVKPFVAVHGISRNAHEHALMFQPLAERRGRAVIVPVYSKSESPRYQRLAADKVRADAALLGVIDDAQTMLNMTIDKFDLFGFSGGAQFAHRFAMIHPDRVASLALASAGWYTMPTMNEAFPYGMGSNNRRGRVLQVNLRRFLAIPMLVLVGERDTRRDVGLRINKSLDSIQGRNRLARAARWTRAVRQAARQWEVRPDVTFRMLPGCGHSFIDCVERGDLVGMTETWLDKRNR